MLIGREDGHVTLDVEVKGKHTHAICWVVPSCFDGWVYFERLLVMTVKHHHLITLVFALVALLGINRWRFRRAQLVPGALHILRRKMDLKKSSK